MCFDPSAKHQLLEAPPRRSFFFSSFLRLLFCTGGLAGRGGPIAGSFLTVAVAGEAAQAPLTSPISLSRTMRPAAAAPSSGAASGLQPFGTISVEPWPYSRRFS
jgi:hypothetical protein